MKKTRYSEDQMVRILREADQSPVTEVAKRHGVSEATIYAWRKKFGELDVTDVRHLKRLEQENARLKTSQAPSSGRSAATQLTTATSSRMGLRFCL